jgi:endonuclease III
MCTTDQTKSNMTMRKKEIEQTRKIAREQFRYAYIKFAKNVTRLAGEGWTYPYQTLLATIASAQTRDEVTIPAMEKVFTQFKTVDEISQAPLEKIESNIRTLNYYKTKAIHIKETANIIQTKYTGIVPQTMEELLQLPGVGRKTANLILGTCFQKPSICVDTHVHRISNVLGWVQTKTPEQTELALQNIFDKKEWSLINRTLVLWGKAVPGTNSQKLLDYINYPLQTP